MTPRLGLFLLVSLLAFSFVGTRGVWEPDEGYYIGVARNMVETGDWIVPQLNLRPFLDKPPMVYWGSAWMMERFGFNEWAARFPHAVWFLLTAVIVYFLGRELFGETPGQLAALIYATSQIPFVAANIVTPDTPFTFWVSFLFLCFWKFYRSSTFLERLSWSIGFGISGGMAFLSKGPATLVYMAPLLLFLLATSNLKRFCFRLEFILSVAILGGIGLSWYAAVIYYLPGASLYFLDNEVVGRLFTEKYNRNPEWYAFLYVYFPVVLFGTLPWSVAWYPRGWERFRERGKIKWGMWKEWDHRVLFLGSAVAVPFLVFCLAKSRLPLYILPLFVPLSVITAKCWIDWKPNWVRNAPPKAVTVFLIAWTVLLISVRGGMSYWPTERDTRAFWNEIKDKLPSERYELVVVNMHKRGLSFYTGTRVEMVTTKTHQYPTFIEIEPLSAEVHELISCAHHHVFLVRDRDLDETVEAIQETGLSYTIEDGPESVHLVLVDPSPPNRRVVRLAALGDTRSGDSGQVQLGSALYRIDEDGGLNGIILLGDNISFFGEPEYYEANFAKPYSALLRAGVKFYAVLGNHDVTGGYAGFQLSHPVFNMKGRRYHSEVFGDNLVECFLLDSNTIAGDPKQIAWLNRKLKKSTARWKLVAMHVPIYGGIKKRPQADEGLRERLEPIFVNGGVDIVVSGHNHVYQRRRPVKGVHYFTAGSGGKLDRGQNLLDDPDLLAGNDRTNVALILEFDENECRFRAIDSLENTIDSGTIPAPSERGEKPSL